MASPAILHVGDDLCHRIPVMERAGLFVVRSEASVRALENVFAQGRAFAGIAFHNDVHPPSNVVVSAARSLSTARLVLFRSPYVSCNERDFDLVIPTHTSPNEWLEALRKAIKEARNLREASAQLRQECRDLRAGSERLHAACNRTHELLLNQDLLWAIKTRNGKDFIMGADTEPCLNA